MKPIYEKLTGCPDEGFIVKEIHGKACNCGVASVSIVLQMPHSNRNDIAQSFCN